MFLSCGCKQQPAQSKGPKIIRVNDVQEIVKEPAYTEDDVNKIEYWLTNTNKTKEETEIVYNLNREHFGEEIQGYCDIACQHRIRRRVEHMKEKLSQWKKDQ